MKRARSLALWLPVLLVITTLGAVVVMDRMGVPEWQIEAEFSKDVFTFSRIKYTSTGRRGWLGSGDWTTDWPDADLNLSFRLQQLTSLKAHPEGVKFEIGDDALYDFPFIYIVEPGELRFTEREVERLRAYLLNGGFLMVDDFWGEREWGNFYQEIKRVFP